MPIPPGAPVQTVGVTQSPCTVSGVGVIGGCVSIDNVEINLNHTFVGDIGILLIGPGGQVLELSTGNGGGGDNYTNTVFTDNTGAFITTGSPPFNGTFRPEGRVTNLNNPYSNTPPLGTHTFANTYNGTNADGVWTLYINDYVPVDVGELLDWSITFNVGGTPPTADAGPDQTICTGLTATLTASGGGTYEWSNGATTATTTVTPGATSTYTVTVTQPGCGSDTDDVVVTVAPPPSISLSVANPNVCVGDCQSVTASLTGTGPFTFTWQFQNNGNPVGSTETVTSGSSPVVFQACPPGGVGPVQVVVCSLNDALCPL